MRKIILLLALSFGAFGCGTKGELRSPSGFQQSQAERVLERRNMR